MQEDDNRGLLNADERSAMRELTSRLAAYEGTAQNKQ